SSGEVELPAFPDVALQIKNVLEDPDVSASQVATVVSADPVFSARLLNIANSAALSSGNTVSDIPSAITRIGFKMAHNVAISIAVNQIMNSSIDKSLQPRFQDLWRHSVNVAAYAYVIARKIAKINPDKALLAGLMHDVGKIYILSRVSENHPELVADQSALDAVLADWHCGVGSAILNNWDMDEELCMVADEHETFNRDILGKADLTDVVLVANLLANDTNPGTEGDSLNDNDWLSLGSFQRLKIDSATLTEIREGFKEEIDSIISALAA
ncbi:MAG TPA: hypothetical protein DCF62_07900, partial [Porticoccaceae bacterium]|nr:hypothetical protein [Porticoccaceae bacterium]